MLLFLSSLMADIIDPLKARTVLNYTGVNVLMISELLRSDPVDLSRTIALPENG